MPGSRAGISLVVTCTCKLQVPGGHRSGNLLQYIKYISNKSFGDTVGTVHRAIGAYIEHITGPDRWHNAIVSLCQYQPRSREGFCQTV